MILQYYLTTGNANLPYDDVILTVLISNRYQIVTNRKLNIVSDYSCYSLLDNTVY